MDPYIYVIVHTPDGDMSVRYCGMSVDVISALLADRGLTGTVVSQETHDAFVAQKEAEAPLP